MNEDEYINKTMEDLILNGALEFSGIDSDTGEMLYSFTDKLKEHMPELYNHHLNFVNEEIMFLWENGFVEMPDMLDDNPKVFLTEKSMNNEEVAKLPKDRQETLREIKRILKVL